MKTIDMRYYRDEWSCTCVQSIDEREMIGVVVVLVDEQEYKRSVEISIRSVEYAKLHMTLYDV